MNNLKVWPMATIAALFIAAFGASVTPTVLAQQSADPARPTGLAPPPPEMQHLEEGEKPAISIEKEQKAPEGSITQQRQQGVVTDIKVNSGGSSYHIIPRKSVDADNTSANGAQWVIKEFDWGQKKEKPAKPGDEQGGGKTAPAPPAAPGS
ncbi:hypothetical protein [Glaciimonas immobilis]|uniref:DUF2782 domain-containing protein n=1 Tax=Glaciimonas immobilis TaxID=728004 RepID=A0A840RTK0_9BURK|nr:hypothetical protein [Glaciimonas immobilis]KAF3997369.1 hypothetical protein HAV38_11815 [Glaciimonas immobilis]MBB5200973.1 hypothetical protein [Glaciimonas immobilis]